MTDQVPRSRSSGESDTKMCPRASQNPSAMTRPPWSGSRSQRASPSRLSRASSMSSCVSCSCSNQSLCSVSSSMVMPLNAIVLRKLLQQTGPPAYSQASGQRTARSRPIHRCGTDDKAVPHLVDSDAIKAPVEGGYPSATAPRSITAADPAVGDSRAGIRSAQTRSRGLRCQADSVSSDQSELALGRAQDRLGCRSGGRRSKQSRRTSRGRCSPVRHDRHDTAAVWDLRLHGEPEGPTFITGTARFVLAIFYIVTTPLSGHTHSVTPCLVSGVRNMASGRETAAQNAEWPDLCAPPKQSLACAVRTVQVLARAAKIHSAWRVPLFLASFGRL